MPTRVMNQSLLMGKGDVSKSGIITENKQEKVVLKKNSSCTQNSSFADESSSSIGKNSDLSENSMEKSGDGEEEVQSSLDAMETLEEVLPIRRGISRFYNGKSKSFASLGDASTAVKDIAKPDNPYNRRRRNLLACTRMGTNGGGVSKRVTSSSRAATLALAVALATSDGSKNQLARGESNISPPSALQLSSGKDFSAWRSFSLADLHQCVSVARSTCTKFGTKPQ